MSSTAEVLDRHLKCFGEGDLAGILADYAPDAVLFTPNGPLRGPDAMRPFFQTVIAEFGQQPQIQHRLSADFRRFWMCLICVQSVAVFICGGI